MSGLRFARPIARPAPQRSPRVIPTPPVEQPRQMIPALFPEDICTFCQTLSLDGLLHTSRDSREEDLFWLNYNRSVPSDCPLCRMLFASMSRGEEITGLVRVGVSADDGVRGGDIYDGRRVREIIVRKCWGGNAYIAAGGGLRVYAENGSYASRFVPGRRAPLSNLSSVTFGRIQSWIRDCDGSHAACQSRVSKDDAPSKRYLPTRVIHVGSATQHPRLHISSPQQSDRYIALSHCWGTSPQVRTLTSNIKQFKEEIIFSTLSKTFKDAIRVTRRLGIEYIWIDSLCIVQDDKDDWLRESERMGNVYTDAYLTLAATWAADGGNGLDSIRPPSNWIKFPCDGTDVEKGHMWLTDCSRTSQDDLDRAPLNSRGWVFQEKLLSRRIIHFAASQVYWECKQRFVGEEFDDRLHFAGRTLEPSQFWADVNNLPQRGPLPSVRTNEVWLKEYPRSPIDEFFHAWRSLTQHYCTLKFTKAADRLTALLGIIRTVELRSGLRCVDGHWDDASSRFVRELAWLPTNHRTLSLLSGDTRARLCSSWSWASLEGGIEYDLLSVAVWADYDLSDCTLHLEAIEAEIKAPWPAHPLRVTGVLRYMVKGEQGDAQFPYQRRPGRCTFILKAERSSEARGWMCFDTLQDELEQFHIAPLYLCDSGARIVCLILRELIIQSEGRWFERVGTGFVEQLRCADGTTQGDMGLFEECERMSFWII